MKFTTREDIEVPIEHAFSAVTDFDGFERQALRRGAEVTRKDAMGKPGVGSEWNLKFPFRGKRREVNARITKFDSPNGFTADSRSGGLDAVVLLDLLALSPQRTRMQFSIELKPQSLSARLLVQSLKFARSNLNKRFAGRVWSFAQTIEEKYQRAV